MPSRWVTLSQLIIETPGVAFEMLKQFTGRGHMRIELRSLSRRKAFLESDVGLPESR